MYPFYTVDAFTTGNNDPFTGNGAGICLLQYDVSFNFQINLFSNAYSSILLGINLGFKKFYRISNQNFR